MGGFQWSLASKTGKIILSFSPIKKTFFLQFFIFSLFYNFLFEKLTKNKTFSTALLPTFPWECTVQKIAKEAVHLIAFIIHVSSQIYMTNEKRCRHCHMMLACLATMAGITAWSGLSCNVFLMILGHWYTITGYYLHFSPNENESIIVPCAWHFSLSELLL